MRILTYEHSVSVDTYISMCVVQPATIDDSIGLVYFDRVVAEVKRLGFKYTIAERHNVIIDKSPELEA